MEHIDDADDPRLSDYRDLTDTQLRRRREPAEGLYIAESEKVIARALAAGHRPRSIMTQRRWLDGVAQLVGDVPVPIYLVPDAVAEGVTGYAVHRGALAAMQRPSDVRVPDLLDAIDARVSADSMPRRIRIAVLEDVMDHTNVGGVFRNAAALGVDAVLVTPRCADPLYRRAVRVSMGTVFQLPWTRIDAWPEALGLLGTAGFVTAGLTLVPGAITLDDLVAEDHRRLALVFGNEGEGMRAQTEQRVDRRVMIPMRNGVDSLNIAASAAVTFYATR
nr:RNA methyltransferase [Microbacterium pseudoresistens]